jgi:ribonucleoside-diphosphate reductase alpha chain
MQTAVGVSSNAQQVIDKRYSIKNEQGQPTETWNEICQRVVTHVAKAESNPHDKQAFTSNLLPIMHERFFLPNTPCLVNAGKPSPQLAGCFVLPVEDSIKGIMKTASNAAIIHQSGGGTGFTFENLRPEGSLVKTTHGVASGPVSFMQIYDTVTEVVKQGGVRRGANMGILRCDHPDILKFIHAKNNEDKLTNFNISVTVTEEFMKAVEKGIWIQTKFNGKPWTTPVCDPLQNDDYEFGSPIVDSEGMINAKGVWERIVESAHKHAEPGVIFIDTVNRHNLLMHSMGPITATNPCAEQALHDNNSCNLGSIDVSKFYIETGHHKHTIDYLNWPKLKEVIYWSVRFLDNVIDTCAWPLPEINDVVSRTRPVGLGIMGFADLLLKMKIRYGSDDSLQFLEQLMSFFQREAWRASVMLGMEKKVFPELEYNQVAYNDFLDKILGTGMREKGLNWTPRNYEVTTIAPTGTISLAAETSSGIEPNFAWSYRRADTVGIRDYIHPLAAKELDISDNDPHTDFILAMKKLPDYFVTAHDLAAEDHIKVLAATQKYIDNGVSKTINAHENDTVESVDKLYRLAYELGVKSVSYYRDGSRKGQVLKSLETKELCPDCNQELQNFDGCNTCLNCGWGKCFVS